MRGFTLIGVQHIGNNRGKEKQMDTIILYSKSFKTKSGGNFTKFLAKHGDKTYDVVISRRFVSSVSDYHEWQLPESVTLSEDDYFIKDKEYTRKDGTKGTKMVLVLLGCQGHEPTKFEKRSFEKAEAKA